MTARTKSSQESLLDPLGSYPSLVLIQYDLGSSFGPILQQVVRDMLDSQTQIIFISQLSTPEKYLGSLESPLLHVLDYSSVVPGYVEGPELDVLSAVIAEIASVSRAPLALVIDSVDQLLADSGSHADTINLLSRLFGHIAGHHSSSRLMLPIKSQSPLLPSLISTSFHARNDSQPPPIHALIHLTLHPPILLAHLVQQYHLALPPIDTPPDPSSSRFWSVFAPVARRGTGERLVMAVNTDELGGSPNVPNQSGNRDQSAGVVDLKTRSRAGGQKGVRTVLRGWRFDHGQGRVEWCGWGDILALRPYATLDVADTAGSNPAMDDVSFNLQLSEAQQQARASVPLPYTNEGKANDGEIIYIPDQADDFDDDDPDDDLYI